MRNKIKDDYYEWLISTAMGSKNHDYDFLCKELFRVKFRWLIPNDVNREFEGKILRERFCDEFGIEIKDSMFDESANLLEIFIGLALRCEWIVMDEVNNLDICYWFREFLHNLELDIFTNNEYRECGGDAKIGMILDRFMNRTYAKNGKGGLFPLKFDDKNQRKVEIWYQMNSYFVENYYVDKS